MRPSAADLYRRKKEEVDRRRSPGNSRGGLNKRIDAARHLADMHLSPGQDGDGPHGLQLLKGFKPGHILPVLGDATLHGDETRIGIIGFKAKGRVEPSTNRTTCQRNDKTCHESRNQVEHFFNRNKHCDRVATRYENPTEKFANFIRLAAFITNVI